MQEDGDMAFQGKLIADDKSFYKTVAAVAIPIALQSLITVGVNMMDTIMVGTLGEVAISATALANQFITIYHIACMGIGMGASVLVSRYYGMKDMVSLKKAITHKSRMLESAWKFMPVA